MPLPLSWSSMQICCVLDESHVLCMSGSCFLLPLVLVLLLLQSGDAKAEATACASQRSCASSYPAAEKHGLLWVWPEAGINGHADSAAARPCVSQNAVDWLESGGGFNETICRLANLQTALKRDVFHWVVVWAGMAAPPSLLHWQSAVQHGWPLSLWQPIWIKQHSTLQHESLHTYACTVIQCLDIRN